MPTATSAATRATLGAVGVSAAVAAVFYAGAAMSGVDGFLGAGEYGRGPAVQVGYDPAGLDRGFGAPASERSYGAFDTYMRSDPGFYYGLFQARPDLGGPSAGTFGNIYVDLDPANNNGSDLGIAVGSAASAFVPGGPGGASVPTNVSVPGVAIARSGDGMTLEFAIPTSLLTGPIPGLTYLPGQVFAAAGNPDVVFGPLPNVRSPGAGGAPDAGAPFGRVAAVATDVPEPATIALFLVGLAGAGAIRRRQASP